MPRPIYIICSESGSEDGRTRLMSIFNIIEKIEITKVKQSESGPTVIGITPFRVSAVWMRSPEDPLDEDYESVFVLRHPDSTETVTQGERFQFLDETAPLVRFLLLAGTPASMPGILRIEHRIRRIGETDWLSQDYPIVVAFTTPEPTPTENGKDDSQKTK